MRWGEGAKMKMKEIVERGGVEDKEEPDKERKGGRQEEEVQEKKEEA